MKNQTGSRAKPFAAMLGLLGIAAATAALAQLSANGSEVAAGQPLAVTLNLPASRAESVYFAIMFGGGIYFVDEAGALTAYQPGVATPRRLASGPQGRHTLFSMTIPTGLLGKADFYSAFGQSGVDVLATAGALDMASLQHVDVTLKAATATAAANGKSLYGEHCALCHGANPLSNIDKIMLGVDAAKTQRAVLADKGGMGYLSTLTDAEHAAIAAWIANPI